MKVNKLIDELEWLFKQIKKYPDIVKKEGAESSDIKRFHDELNSLKSSIKFDFGDADEWPDYDFDIGYPNLPYDNVYFETRINGGVFAANLFYIDDEEIAVNLYSTKSNGKKISLTDIYYRITKTPFEIYVYSRRDDISNGVKNTLNESLKSHLRLFEIINCSNIELVNNKPSKLKQSRIKKGKTKLFEYKTLHIKQNTKRNINKGEGKHASPRVHLRRGHIRKLPSGVTTWVQPCVVGDKSKGVIHKDYTLDKEVA